MLSGLSACWTGWRQTYPELQCSTKGSQHSLELLLPPENIADYQGARPHSYLHQCYQTLFLFKLKQKKGTHLLPTQHFVNSLVVKD